VRRFGRVIRRRQHAPARRGDPEGGEKLAVHELHLARLRRLFVQPQRRAGRIRVGRDASTEFRRRRQPADRRRAEQKRLARRVRHQAQLLRLRHRQGLEQHAAHEREHRSRRADAEREHRHETERERRPPRETAPGDAEIVHPRLERRPAERVLGFLARREDVAESEMRLAARLDPIEAAPDVLLREQLDVVAHFFLEARHAGAAAEEVTEFRPEFHGVEKVGRRVRARRGVNQDSAASTASTSAVTRCQLATSSFSCFRPAAVIA